MTCIFTTIISFGKRTHIKSTLTICIAYPASVQSSSAWLTVPTPLSDCFCTPRPVKSFFQSVDHLLLMCPPTALMEIRRASSCNLSGKTSCLYLRLPSTHFFHKMPSQMQRVPQCSIRRRLLRPHDLKTSGVLRSPQDIATFHFLGN